MSQSIVDMHGTLRFDSLNWVNDELRQLLVDIQRELESVTRDDNVADIQQVRNILEQLTGTLSLIEVNGAALLSKEMAELVTAYQENQVTSRETALELLISSSMRIEDYLDYLSAGNADIPALLLPIINDLREARKADLMSDKVIFMPDFHSAMDTIEIQALDTSDAQSLAKKRRIAYQVGLLDMLRNENRALACSRMQTVLLLLYKASKERLPANMWWIGAALIDVIGEVPDEEKLQVLMILGKLDRMIKALIDEGEEGLQKLVSFELIKGMLYYLAKSEVESERVRDAKEIFKLEDYLIKDLRNQTSSWLGPPNKQLIDTVSKALFEDVSSVKDVIDVYSHSDRKDVSSLKQASEVLQKIGDTLTMLGLGATKDRIMSEKAMLDQHITDQKPMNDEGLMLVASVLLTIEEDLEAYRDNRDTLSDAKSNAANDSNDDTKVIAENRKVTGTLANEALRDLSWVKDVYLDYLQASGQVDILNRVPKVLQSISGAMFVDPLSGIVPAINELKDYVENVLIAKAHQPSETEQNIFAEVITNIECFLEATVESRLDAELFIDSANLSLDELENISPAIPSESEGIAAITDDLEELAGDMQLEVPVVEMPILDSNAEEVIRQDDPVEAYKALQVVAADADSEIIEIFLEEAREEVARISEMYPEWKASPESDGAVTVIRRSFHTLKGSGRIVGAQLIGEFAWKFENLLNRIIDGTIDANLRIFDAVAEAIPVLPKLIEQIETRETTPLDDVYALMHQAEVFSATQHVAEESDKPADTVSINADDVEATVAVTGHEPVEVGQVAETISLDAPEFDNSILDEDDLFSVNLESPELEVEDVNEPILDTDLPLAAGDNNLESDDLLLSDELLADAEDLESINLLSDEPLSNDDSVQGADDLLGFDVEEDIVDDAIGIATKDDDSVSSVESVSDELLLDELEQSDELMEDLAMLNDAFAEDEHVVPKETAVAETSLDIELIRIFTDEVSTHLRTIEEFIDESGRTSVPLHGHEALYRAFHTIHGSARTSPTFSQIASLAEGLEKLYNGFKTLGMPWAGHDLELLRQSLNFIRDDLKALSQNNAQFVDVNNIIANVQARYDEIKTKLTAQYKILTDTQAHEIDEELVDVFMEEGEELLDILDRAVHEAVSKNAVDSQLPEILRVLHTLKGSARMANLSPVGDLSHTLESVFVAVAENKLEFNDHVKAVVQKSTDSLSNMVQLLKGNQSPVDASALMDELNDLVKNKGAQTPVEEEQAPAQQEDDQLLSELESFADAFDIEESVDLPEAEFIEPEVAAIETVEELKPSVESFEAAVSLEDKAETESVVQTSTEKPEEIQEISVPAVSPKPSAPATKEKALDQDKDDALTPAAVRQDMVRVQAGRLENLVNYAGEVNIFQSRLGQYINDLGANLNEVDGTLERLRSQLRNMELETEEQISSRLEQEKVDPNIEFDPLEMDRYSNMQHLTRAISESADDLLNIRSTLGDLLRESEAAVLQQSRVATDLQDGLLKTQMVSFQGLVSRLRRLVRQTALQLNKKVEISIKGFDTEIDRSVQVALVSSLEHMLRNAIFHGIEMPADRIKLGKSETGRINMEVRRDGSYIVILINDDGAGIDPTKVRNKAIALGLIKPEQEVEQKDILQLILHSGFSTATEVSQIAGRGVGMDVVDSSIKELGGALQIESTLGIGTSFAIRLPQTLSISNGLMLELGDVPYVVLLSAITGIATIAGDKLKDHINGDFSAYEYGNEIYPVHYLGSLFNMPVPETLNDPNIQIPLIMIKGAGQKIALIVDRMLGKRELVVKPVGVQLSTVRGVSGATILGDGTVCFILDAIELLQSRIGGQGENVIKITHEKAQPQPMAVQPVIEEVARKQKIMVVDDSITIRKVSQRLLERNGYDVVLAKDGVDAIEQLTSVTPDIFLLDIEMPRMDGFELAGHIRNTDKISGLPIIMITSRTGAKHRERAEALSVNCYLGKPFQEAELLQEIDNLIGD